MSFLNRILIILICNLFVLSLSAQLGSYGNTYVESGEKAIHGVEANFQTSGTGTLPGIIATNRKDIAYVSFVGPSSALNGANDKYIDGYSKSYYMTSFLFPIGDNGNYAPVKFTANTPNEIISAAYFFVNASTAITSSVSGGNEPILPIGGPFNIDIKEPNVKGVSPIEYWDIDGTGAVDITLTWNDKSKIGTLTANSLDNLTIVGWNGTLWEEISSKVDITSVLGSASSLTSGSITSTLKIVPNTYTAYTFGTKNIIKKDTTITTDDSTVVIIGVPVIPPTGGTVTATISGPKVAGTATVDSTGVVTLVPVSPTFVGKDTIMKVVCITTAAWETNCDTTYIFIDNPGDTVSSSLTMDENTTATTTSKIKDYTFEGGEPTVTINGPSNGVASLNEDGTVTYTPTPGFVGKDTVEIVRCDSKGNCVVDVFYFEVQAVREVLSEEIPNYFSPNGDGVNDYFDISAIQKDYPNAKLEVYNRWGNIVYRSIGAYRNDWNGDHGVNDEPLPDAIYYYIIELGDEFSKVKTGFVEIMRQ